jgi:hypothetical protein
VDKLLASGWRQLCVDPDSASDCYVPAAPLPNPPLRGGGRSPAYDANTHGSCSALYISFYLPLSGGRARRC